MGAIAGRDNAGQRPSAETAALHPGAELRPRCLRRVQAGQLDLHA
jgi:hypothetical protein